MRVCGRLAFYVKAMKNAHTGRMCNRVLIASPGDPRDAAYYFYVSGSNE